MIEIFKLKKNVIKKQFLQIKAKTKQNNPVHAPDMLAELFTFLFWGETVN